LVVDDESDLREMLTRSFSREGHRVMAVADGRAAIDRASTDAFDIVLLDVAQRVWREPLASWRKSRAFASDAGAVATWLRLGELEAATIETFALCAQRREPSMPRRRRAPTATSRTG
jgi:CheY-like chemotaxis protein